MSKASSPTTRLKNLASHLLPGSAAPTVDASPTKPTRPVNYHPLSPTIFLPRAAAIEPGALAIVHKTANGKLLRRSYQEFADRARGLAYYLKHHNYRRVGMIM